MHYPDSHMLNFVAATLTLTAVAHAALPTITIKGSKFFTSNGDQWFIKGVAYQLLPNDPLSDTVQCQLDANLMKELGANAIRTYHVDASANHDGCMQAFADAGIYVFVDLDTFPDDIDEAAPIWTPAQMGAFQLVMDAFHKYDNLAGFFIGNEVVNDVGPDTEAAPYIKASTADLKAYRDAKGYRDIPIGYSHADVAGLRPALQDYLVCGDEPSQTIDFFGLNCYEWCGVNGYVQSGYALLAEQTATYPVPIFMSETGCNTPEPRIFADQNAIFTNMSTIWSGAVVYEWIQEDNHYGLITYGGGNTNALDYDPPAEGFFRSGTPTPITPDFANLLTQWQTLHPTGTAMADYTPTNTRPACPAYTAGVWQVAGDVPLPTLGLSVVIPTSSALSMANFGLSTATVAADMPSTTTEKLSTAAVTPASTMKAVASPSSSSASSHTMDSPVIGTTTTSTRTTSITSTASAASTRSTNAATADSAQGAASVGSGGARTALDLCGILLAFFYFS